MTNPRLDATVTLTRYGEPDELLLGTLEALSHQIVDRQLRVLVLDQRESSRVEAFCLTRGRKYVHFQYEVIPPKSLSFARNEAIRRCATRLLLFLDTDAAPRPRWAQRLTEALSPADVGIAGGRIVPRWSRPPLWLAKSRIVLEQYSMLDLGEGTKCSGRVIGANFGIDLGKLNEGAHFDEGLGRRSGVLLGGEETDLCRRTESAGFKVVYAGDAIVDHYVPADRISYSWLFRRFYYGGFSRGLQGGAPQPITSQRTTMDWVALAALGAPYAFGLAVGRTRRH